MTLQKHLGNKVLVWTTPARTKLGAQGVLLKEKRPVTFEKKIQCRNYKGRHNCRLKGKDLFEFTAQDAVSSMSLAQLSDKGLTSLATSSTMFLSHSPILIGLLFHNCLGVILCLRSRAWGWKRILREKEEVVEEQGCSEKCNFTKQFHLHEVRDLSWVHKRVLRH